MLPQWSYWWGTFTSDPVQGRAFWKRKSGSGSPLDSNPTGGGCPPATEKPGGLALLLSSHACMMWRGREGRQAPKHDSVAGCVRLRPLLVVVVAGAVLQRP